MPDGSSLQPARPKESLYEAHKKIHPRAVSGRFRRLKWLAVAGLLGIFFVVPWLRWDRGADAPGQAVLFDLEQARFFLFGIEIWPQEIYYLTGLLIVAAVGLFLATALAGRVWCGFGCPHTVWTDLFIRIEHFFEGDRAERIRLDKAKWSRRKLLRKGAKHLFWTLVAAISGFGFVAYFTDAPTLAHDVLTLDVSGNVLSFLALFTVGTYAMAGYTREQMCKYMCPWPRIQTAMLDEHSLVVTYQTHRGDNRAPKRKSESWEQRLERGFGDCIDCNQCVQVCPMGIDVRTGAQADCINCGLCVDACDTIMDGMGRPRGLIAFDTLARQAMVAAAPPSSSPPFSAVGGCAAGGCATAAPDYRVPLLRARVVVYLVVMVLVGALMTATFANRARFDVSVLRDRAPLFVTLRDGSLRNAYTFKVANKTREHRAYALAVGGIAGAILGAAGEDATDTGVVIEADPDSVATYRVYVTVPKGAVTAASTPVTFTLTETTRGDANSHDSVFLGPAE
ncbi:cytochrome c oxidase accessory protein CcoG [Azospirillum sp. A39]|uniref:cytochrome c oxidase accessory protein CcoG n=1 Tax=Azospirillum sp. A39 TaxID=3462279 RepID=UPI0040461F2E